VAFIADSAFDIASTLFFSDSECKAEQIALDLVTNVATQLAGDALSKALQATGTETIGKLIEVVGSGAVSALGISC
jgi:hypothetical protein